MIGRCFILLLVSCESIAQTYTGPSYQAMGYTGTALEGIYSLTGNPAGLSGLENIAVGLNYQHHFLTTAITTQTALVGVPTRLGTFGSAVSRYGMKQAYDDTKAGLFFAKRFGPKFSVGMSANYNQLYIPGYLYTFSVSVDIGMQYRFGQGPIIGLHYANLGNADYGVDAYGTIPSFVRMGLSYPMKGVTIAADVAYRMERALGGHLGVEYRLGEILCLRGGLSINPMQQHAGFGVRWLQFVFDAAATFHPRLGTSPQIGICYAF